MAFVRSNVKPHLGPFATVAKAMTSARLKPLAGIAVKALLSPSPNNLGDNRGKVMKR